MKQAPSIIFSLAVTDMETITKYTADKVLRALEETIAEHALTLEDSGYTIDWKVVEDD